MKWLPRYLIIKKIYIRYYEDLNVRNIKEILIVQEECRYCKKTYNNAGNIYSTLAIKQSAPTLPGII